MEPIKHVNGIYRIIDIGESSAWFRDCPDLLGKTIKLVDYHVNHHGETAVTFLDDYNNEAFIFPCVVRLCYLLPNNG